MTEDQLQAKCWQWAWNEYPLTRRCLWAVPNGGGRQMAEAIKFQATGVLAGVHDLHMLWDGQFYTFELKVGTNPITTDRVVNGRMAFGQKEWGAIMLGQGGRWFEVRDDPEVFKKIFRDILLGLYKRR